MKIERIRLEAVEFMPAQLEAGVLYASKKYRTAAHLCACGCGEKVRTQLGPLGWSLTKGRSGPTLYPSIGNWQKPCRSHYYIRDGCVIWQPGWTDAEVLEGRRAEEARRDAHFQKRPEGWLAQFGSWLKKRH
jgi:Family of unknown function (DUF6527)